MNDALLQRVQMSMPHGDIGLRYLCQDCRHLQFVQAARDVSASVCSNWPLMWVRPIVDIVQRFERARARLAAAIRQ